MTESKIGRSQASVYLNLGKSQDTEIYSNAHVNFSQQNDLEVFEPPGACALCQCLVDFEPLLRMFP